MRKPLVSLVTAIALLLCLMLPAVCEESHVYSLKAADQFVNTWNDFLSEADTKITLGYFRTVDQDAVGTLFSMYNADREEVRYQTDQIPGNAYLLFLYDVQTGYYSFCIFAEDMGSDLAKVVIYSDEKVISDAILANTHEPLDMWCITLPTDQVQQLYEQDQFILKWTIDGKTGAVEISRERTGYIYEMCSCLMNAQMFADTSDREYMSAALLPDGIRPTPKPQTGSVKTYSFREDLDAIDLAAKSVFYVEALDREGRMLQRASGFVAFDEHLFITNQHVIQGAVALKVEGEDGSRYLLDQVAVSDEARDIAILLFPGGDKYKALEMDAKTELKRGQPVVAIGNPIGFRGTVSYGNISAFPKMGGFGGVKCIQFTAPVSHGSSGGCVFDDRGKLIGVASAFGVSELSGEVGENISLAVPISIVIELYDRWDKSDTEPLGTDLSWDTVQYK